MPKIPLAEKLISQFRTTFEGAPEWAWPFEPSIPLVGRNYKPGRGLLVYASAENLSWMQNPNHERRRYFDEAGVWNRYREQYEHLGRNSNSFFPDVGIQPVTDGGLFAAALFVSDALGFRRTSTPRALLETIAVTNWCKFTIEPPEDERSRNRDYIRNLGKLTGSLSFVVGELAEPRPAVALVPKAVWDKPVLQGAMRGASPWTQFRPVLQFNPTVVNTSTDMIACSTGAEQLHRKLSDTPLGEWMANLQGFKKINAWRYIALLNKQIGKRRPRCVPPPLRRRTRGFVET